MSAKSRARKVAPKKPRPIVQGLAFRISGEHVRDLWLGKAAKHRKHSEDWQREADGFRSKRDAIPEEDPAQKPERSSQEAARRASATNAERHERDAASCEFYAEHTLTDAEYVLGLQELALLNPFIPVPKE